MAADRLLSLLSLLQARRDWPGAELAGRLAVSRRTIRRDVERLRGLGYPVESLPGPAGGYRLQAGAAMPPLLLDDDEAVAIAVGLATAARSSVTGIEETSVRALVKLEQVLPAHLRRRVRALQAAMTTLPGEGPTVDAGHLVVIAAACRDRERLRFRYTAGGVRPTERREAEPYALVHRGRRWYLVAWDCGRRDWRTFRLDRLAQPASTGVRFTPRELPAESPAAYVEGSFTTRRHRYEARIVVHEPAASLRTRQPWYTGRIEPLGDDRCELQTGDDDLAWLTTRVIMLGADFEVREPPELIESLRGLAARVGRGVDGV